jgi:geranylgeranyl diphosphate synthase type II
MEVEDRYLRLALTLFYAAATDVCEGQQWDMNFETQSEVSVEDYIRMIGAKTATLLACALSDRRADGRRIRERLQRIHSFGKKPGHCLPDFTNDVLDLYGDEKKFGKKPGGDIVSNKKTFLLLSAMQDAGSSLRDELAAWLAAKDFDPSEKISAVNDYFFPH